MTITREAASTWTKQGAQDGAQQTYASVRDALERNGIAQSRSLEIFLQGSYANSTNVRSDSDVDIVVMTKQVFNADTSRLSTTSKAKWNALPNATYTSSDLRQEVTRALMSYYGPYRVHLKNKCIRVDAGSGTLDADVVPCTEYRNYTVPDPSSLSAGYIEGVMIRPLQGDRVINYPKEHIANGKAKNQRAHLNYKQTVRQVKRLRTFAVEKGLLREGIAPGYLLECMVFNAPDSLFAKTDDWDRLLDVVIWLRHEDLSALWSGDKVHRLFVTDPGNFSTVTAKEIIEALWEAI